MSRVTEETIYAKHLIPHSDPNEMISQNNNNIKEQ